MKQYDDYYDDSETEERVQVAQETCENEEDILEAIERSKRQLKHSKVPFGYEKLDEEIITTVYKLPENEIIHRSNEANIEEINHRIIKEKYITNNNYENKRVYNSSNTGKKGNSEDGTIYNYNCITKNHGYYEGKNSNQKNDNSYKTEYKSYNKYKNNSSQNYGYNNNIKKRYHDEKKSEKYTNYSKIKGGQIENYFENQVSQDGDYLVSMTLSKKVMEKGKSKPVRGKYNINFYKEEIEIDENEGEEDYGENIRPEYINNQNFKKITNTQTHSLHFPSDY